MAQPSLEFIVQRESQVWDALVHGDAAADEAMLAPDFLGVYATGFADRATHAAQLVNGPTMASYEISAARMVTISDSAVLLCYRATYRPLLQGEAGAAATMYISSLWTESDGEWLNLFSQDTAAE
ncbi:MAG: hypothetical protein QOI61_1513 [Actinomycetota bacterium]|jgi:hypothetical protein